MTRTSATDRARALLCLTTAIYYEAASEPDAGQRAVAQVILNRVRHPAFPATVCGVVYQGPHSGGAPTACQFSFACDGATARAPASLRGSGLSGMRRWFWRAMSMRQSDWRRIIIPMPSRRLGAVVW
ncbi:cell wall hydrolase [Sphingomonas aerolata]|uniref:cell wall hydrolase n=1 Tax=Sphingomonas aerolata TaxID=185951 RepID=UPI003A5C34F8